MSHDEENETTTDDPQTTEFVHEDELREQAEHEPLGGADVEHCQRMRG
jgi:hypothetical protein